MSALVTELEHDLIALKLLQAQVLAQLRVSLVVAAFPHICEKQVIFEQFLRLLDLFETA